MQRWVDVLVAWVIGNLMPAIKVQDPAAGGLR